MPDSVKKILVVDDEEKFLHSIVERLKLLGFTPLKASNGSEALALAKKNPIDLAIVDLKMPGIDGLITITKLKELYPHLRSVLLTGYGSEKVRQASDAIQSAYFEKDRMQDFWDFIKKSSDSGNTIVIRPPGSGPLDSDAAQRRSDAMGSGSIEIISERTLAADRQDTSRMAPGEARAEAADLPRMIGENHAMQLLRRNIARVAALDCTVIIRGETGVGKELAARIIHHSSPRRKNRFLAFNCGCFSSDLLIEELFASGSRGFMGAAASSGPIPQSESGGTILLDQIEDMPLKMQLSMLKILDNKESYRQEKQDFSPFDVRILVASRHNLGKLVEAEKFRAELYHRLNLMELFIPPLRERRDDIPPLSHFFLRKYAQEFSKPVQSISGDVMSIFLTYDFPGNVRELEHVIERAVILTDGDTIKPNHLPARFKAADTVGTNGNADIMTLAEVEKNHILKTLQATGGNKSKTAELLGISRSALWRKLNIFREA
jgi:DNA-binding NtrC family response regulator